MKTQACHTATMIAAVVALSSHAVSDWIHFVDETAQRLVAEPSVGADDTQQKYFAHGDLNNNGRIDVVVVRKQPFNSPGRRVNVLLMNEGIAEGHAIDGVLVDRTKEYASSADGPGNGFLDETNDTSVIIVDVNGNGWLDVVTSTTLSSGQPVHISHPRVYINLGLDKRGDWQGLRYESGRLPEFALEPRFVEVDAGDVTGDGSPDLFFGYAYLGGPPLDPEDRLGDRLLINDGSGHFADESEQRLLAEGSLDVLTNAIKIVDINSNGINDLVKNRYLAAYYTGISYNDPQNVGYFTVHDNVHQISPSYVAVGDLNNNSLLDLFITDIGWDRYLLNQGNDDGGIAQFEMHLIPDSSGFHGRLVIVDLDHDGWLDVFKPDVHYDLGTCSGGGDGAPIYRNNADGPNITFTHDQGSFLPVDLRRTFHVAAVDINHNGRTDLVIGRCAGTAIWMNEPVPIVGDLNGDGTVDISDLLILLGAWGACGQPCPADLNSDGVVNVSDLLLLLGNWG